MATPRQLVLVTGSAGYLGTALVDVLARGYHVVGLDLKAPKHLTAGTDFIDCDLTDDASVTNALGAIRQRHGDEVTSCVHLAAHYDFSGKESPLYHDLTIEGTRRLLRGLQDFTVEQFVFSSTHIVMRPSVAGEPITESSPVEPAWDYPRSKLVAERIVSAERGRIPAVILRLAGVYDEDTHVVPIAQQMSRIYEKQLESVLFPGDARHGQAYVHLDDAVSCFVKSIERRHGLGPYEVFLVAEPDLMSYAELQEQLGELIYGEEWPTIRIPKAVAKAGAWVQEKLAAENDDVFIRPWMIDLADDHYPLDIDRARQKLGWQATRSLRATLPDMVSRLKRDPEVWYRTNKLKAPDAVPKAR